MFIFGLLGAIGFFYAAYKFGSLPAEAAAPVAVVTTPAPPPVTPKPKYHRK